MTFHLMFVDIIFGSIWVAKWPSFGKELLTQLYFDYLLFKLFPILV